MQQKHQRVLWISFAVLSAAFSFVTATLSSAPQAATAVGQAPRALPPAANLRIQVGQSLAQAPELLDPAAPAWQAARSTSVLLNRTPRIYQTEPIEDRPIPHCAVRAIRALGKLYFRLQWGDATRNEPRAPPAQRGTAGEPKLLYKRPTAETAAFADASALMVPENWVGPHFPSLLMGEKDGPALVYYWNASRGAEELKASGRATPQPTGRKVPFRATHAGNEWLVTLQIPDQPDGYPIALAVWDGQFGDRDGLKFFSPWYVLVR